MSGSLPEVPMEQVTFQLYGFNIFAAHLKRTKAIIKTKQRKLIWNQNILIRSLKTSEPAYT